MILTIRFQASAIVLSAVPRLYGGRREAVPAKPRFRALHPGILGSSS